MPRDKGKGNKYKPKVTNDLVNFELLDKRMKLLIKGGYPKAKWIEFCETLISEGYNCYLYEARQTFSKYITVHHPNNFPFKVRFSNHKPILERELKGDCDFFVGKTNTGQRNTESALKAVRQHFSNIKSEVKIRNER